MRLFVCLALATTSIAACGGESTDALAAPSVTKAEGTGAVAEPAVSAAAMPKGLNVAFGAPGLIAASSYASRAMVVEAVYRATEMSGAAFYGGITNTGTIQVSHVGAQYLPQPNDKLVVDMAGQRHEFVVKNVQGNSQALDSATWLASPHVLNYTHVAANQAAAEIDIQFDGTSFEVRVRGRATLGGERTQVELKATGQASGVRDHHGQDVTTKYSLIGTVRGEGFEVEVREEHASQLVAATSLRTLPSMRGSSSRVHSRIWSVLQSGGVEYRFDGVQVQSDYTEKGGNTTNQETQLTGAISKDGQPYGQCTIDGGVPVLQTADGVVDLSLR